MKLVNLVIFISRPLQTVLELVQSRERAHAVPSLLAGIVLAQSWRADLLNRKACGDSAPDGGRLDVLVAGESHRQTSQEGVAATRRVHDLGGILVVRRDPSLHARVDLNLPRVDDAVVALQQAGEQRLHVGVGLQRAVDQGLAARRPGAVGPLALAAAVLGDVAAAVAGADDEGVRLQGHAGQQLLAGLLDGVGRDGARARVEAVAAEKGGELGVVGAADVDERQAVCAAQQLVRVAPVRDGLPDEDGPRVGVARHDGAAAGRDVADELLAALRRADEVKRPGLQQRRVQVGGGEAPLGRRVLEGALLVGAGLVAVPAARRLPRRVVPVHGVRVPRVDELGQRGRKVGALVDDPADRGRQGRRRQQAGAQR